MAKKKKMTVEEQAHFNKQKSLQEFLEIEDIENGMFKSKQGYYYPCFNLGEKNIELYTMKEQAEFASNIDVILASTGVVGYQILQIPMPSDISAYKGKERNQVKALAEERVVLSKELDRLNQYDDKETNIDAIKILNDRIKQIDASIEYIQNQDKHIQLQLQSGEVAPKVSYCIPIIGENWNPEVVREGANLFEDQIKGFHTNAYRCTENEMKNVVFALLNPIRKIQSSVLQPTSTTILEVE